ncbi:MAG: hypothetical protein A3C07_00385 [Candidatus Sungbacteria bacterium RIFCSPHIGHO2_02_FULL_47_11]|uniref:Uncharacterized protein n=1 Tax=Candidatus Sungbacteria bacterium RIFCSPHIGHO2_02_FULL_47_11 TaxID=1802270 RepID=A0A1G2KMN9_9BACT|nr:MAG: hypothetical protein A3C07_00385 [Candidatus Sungbacteria bacterium RIFCSPHIGHO2_02_FULL_47_11]
MKKEQPQKQIDIGLTKEILSSDAFDKMKKHELLKLVYEKKLISEPVTKNGVVEGFRIVDPATGDILYYEADPVYEQKPANQFKDIAELGQATQKNFQREKLEELEDFEGPEN